MKYIYADLLRKEIEKNKSVIDGLFTEGDDSVYDGENDAYNRVLRIIDSLQQEQSEKDNELTIKDLELLHTFLYAVKNNKQGAFTFTRLSDEQYNEVLRRFKEVKNDK